MSVYERTKAYIGELYWFDPIRAEVISAKVARILEDDPKVDERMDGDDFVSYASCAMNRLRNEDPCLFM